MSEEDNDTTTPTDRSEDFESAEAPLLATRTISQIEAAATILSVDEPDTTLHAWLNLTDVLLARARQVRQMVEVLAIEWISANGPTHFGDIFYTIGYKTPYYRHPRSRSGRRKRSIYNNMIRTDLLHAAVINVLAKMLLDVDDLRPRLMQHLAEQRAAAMQDQPDVAALEAERATVRQDIDFIMDSLSGAARTAVAGKLKRLGERLNAIEDSLSRARDDHHRDTRPVEVVVEVALQVLVEDSQRLLTLPVEPLRHLVRRLLVDAVVDMESKSVELTIALPAWALLPKPKPKKKPAKGQKAASDGKNAVCPGVSLRSSMGSWTHAVLGRIGCEYQWSRGSHTRAPCFQCKRLAA